MPISARDGLTDLEVRDETNTEWTAALLDAAHESGRLNRIAAKWTAAAIALDGLSAVASAEV